MVTMLLVISGARSAKAEQPPRIGVSVGPYREILEIASDLAKEQGLETKIVTFTDHTMPNAALAAGDIIQPIIRAMIALIGIAEIISVLLIKDPRGSPRGRGPLLRGVISPARFWLKHASS